MERAHNVNIKTILHYIGLLDFDLYVDVYPSWASNGSQYAYVYSTLIETPTEKIYSLKFLESNI